MSLAAKVLVVVFLVATMFGIALDVGPRDLLSLLRDRRRMIAALAANFVVAPLLGWLVVKVIPLSAPTATGLLLLAAAPGGLNAIQFTGRVHGGLAYAATLLFVLSLLSVAISPLIIALLLPSGMPVVVPYGRAFAILLSCVLGPLVVGMVLKHARPRAASRLVKPMIVVGTLAFVAVVILLLSWRKQAAEKLTGIDLVTMAGYILAMMIIGWLMGGPGAPSRSVLATATSMRNAALALAISIHSFPGRQVDLAIIVFSGLMIPPNMLLTVYHIVRDRRRRHHARHADA